MSLDWKALLYDPVYAVLSVDAVLMIDSNEHEFKVMDKTAPVEVGENIETLTFFPYCTVRAKDLLDADVDLDELDDQVITFNGKSWKIKNHQVNQAPTGQAQGEIRMTLEEA